MGYRDGRLAGLARVQSARAEEILGVAASLFEDRGYSVTTMSDIAEAAGVLPGSLYHHFDSKEAIVVALLEAFNRDLAELAARIRSRGAEAKSPESALRDLAAEATALSMRHAAATRLRVYEAPSVASARMRDALQYRALPLLKVWVSAVDALRTVPRNPKLDTGLLRFALQRLTVSAAVTYPTSMSAQAISDHLCDALLGGIIRDCPDDGELDRSPVMRAARACVSEWAPPNAKSTDIRMVILAAARQEFARRGYDATTIRDIADAAGVKMGTLYRRIDSKEGLLREIVDNYSEKLDEAVRVSLTMEDATEAEALDALGYVFLKVVRIFDQEAKIVRFGWSSRHSIGPFQDYFKRTQDRLVLLENLLQRGQRSGAIKVIGTPADLAPHLRSLLWIPFREYERSGMLRSQRFIRESLFRGSLTTA